MDRLKDTSVADGLLSYLLRPREEGLALHLWVAERMSEREWLTADGVRMDSATWLAFTLAFITNEERQVLGVPSEAKRKDQGYSLEDLKAALDKKDPSTFRYFRQVVCRDPVALRVVVDIHKLSVEKEKNKGKKKGGDFGKTKNNDWPNRGDKIKNLEKKENDKKVSFAQTADSVNSLPMKNGKPDQNISSKFKPGGLRQRVWTALQSNKCVRCGGDRPLEASMFGG